MVGYSVCLKRSPSREVHSGKGGAQSCRGVVGRPVRTRCGRKDDLYLFRDIRELGGGQEHL